MNVKTAIKPILSSSSENMDVPSFITLSKHYMEFIIVYMEMTVEESFTHTHTHMYVNNEGTVLWCEGLAGLVFHREELWVSYI